MLTNLPEEIVIMILRKLDLNAIHNMYNTCKWIRNIVCMDGVMKHCNLSRNVMGTVHTLKLQFFKAISPTVVELNMSGVPDLSKTYVIPAIKKLTKLKALDISYTHLNMLDLIEIKKVSPNLNDITINYICGKSTIISNNVLLEYQSLFEQFENIHFLGSIDNLLNSKLALYLVSKANLKNLRYTIVESRSICYSVDDNLLQQIHLPQLDSFMIYLLEWKCRSTVEKKLEELFPMFSVIKLETFEYIFVFAEELRPKVYASSRFINFFQEKFNVTVECYELTISKFSGNIALMMWNKETVQFNEQFYSILAKQLKQYFPYYFLLHSKCHELPAPVKYDWYYTIPLAQVDDKYKDYSRGLSKKRQGAPNYLLNYDVIFRDKQLLALSLVFKYPINSAIELDASCTYLKKLTYLSLVGLGRCSYDFFIILFQWCVNLVTLNVQAVLISPCASAIARSLSVNKSLKNLRIVDKRIDFKNLFLAFSQTPNLENIFVVDESSLEYNELANPAMVVEKCANLYSIYIETLTTDAIRTRTLQMFNKAKSKYNRSHLNVNIQKRDEPYPWNYYPFVDVFMLNPVTPV